VYTYFVAVFFLFSSFIARSQAPVANFTSNVTAGCAPLVVNFQDLSTGSPKFWNWDLGNGQLSNLQNPVGVYQTPGTYTVTLVVRNANGTHGVTKTNYITVYPSPLWDFISDKTIGCEPSTIQFSDRSIDTAGSIVKWQWDFGDGGTSTVQNPSHLYSNTGFYTVSLKVTSSTGCTSQGGKYRYVRIVSGVTPDFTETTDSVCSAPFTVNFLNQTSGPGTLTYSWDFGNGNTSTAANPVATYNAAGNYNVRLIAQSEYGCADTAIKVVNIKGASTTFTAVDSACVAAAINFQNTSTPAPISSRWVFGDGSASTQINPAKRYNTPGTYTVKLYNQYAHCSDSTSKQVLILNYPPVDFTANVQTSCKGPLTVQFQDLSPNAATWQWDFGDGQQSNQRNPTHTYTTYGNYDVRLTITTPFGCGNSKVRFAFIKIQKPVVNIDNVPTGGCLPFNFSPVANVVSLDAITSFDWSFGDGGTASGRNVTHTYVDSGTYTVKLVVTTAGGCKDSVSVVNAVKTGPVPFVDFVVDTTSTCAFGSIKFKSISFPADQWTWDFGDGIVSATNVDSVYHSYMDTGSFTVTLTAYNNGCPKSVAKPLLITVHPPIAYFVDTIMNCNQKKTVNFYNRSITDPSYGVVSYVWEFGDPANSTSTVLDPLFTYPALGTYTVTLTVKNGNCTNVITKSIDVVAEVADFTASKTTPCKNEVINLLAINSNPANIGDYRWSFNGGPPLYGGSIQTAFGNNGSYSVELTITDKNGCTDTKLVNNYITVTGPNANFTAIDTGGCQSSIIRFADSTTPVGSITQWKWNFGDGQSQTFTAPPFVHQYADTGLFRIDLTVTDKNGCTDTKSIDSVVRITKPKADFYALNTLFCSGGQLQFKDSSSAYGNFYNWYFGDGGSSNLKDPIHTYSGVDSMYSVKLVITDVVGCKDSITKLNYIQIKSPKPAFDAQDTSSICPPLETKFTLRAQDIESYYWDFGDGQTSLLQNPNHFYNTYGTYDAKLYVVGHGGCVDSATRTITVFNPYSTLINYSPLESCNDLNVDFAISPPPHTRAYFFFGDGVTDSSQSLSFSHFYKAPSFYSPYMTLVDALDCQVIVGGPNVIKIYGAEPFFGIDKRAFCDSGTVYFTNYTITNDTIVNSHWDFGDGTTSTLTNDVHKYLAPGTYYPSLTASTTRGCTKTISDTIKVSGTPQPVITSADLVCINSLIQFNGSLVIPDTAITWSWALGNGQISSQQNVATAYNSTGSPQIKLEAANFLGCKSDVTKNITVVPLPEIKIFADPVIVAGTGTVIPATYSSNVTTYSWSPAPGLSCLDCANPYAKPQFTTRYKVSVVDSNGCTSSRNITVTVVCNDQNYFIPNTFSPNGDGMNDVFYPRGSGINRIQSMRIFNRWGQMVFEKKNFIANDASQGWDGKVNGKPADQDVYVYIIEFICDNASVIPIKGNVALIR
jgi:gliding motility-associated-like protein